jgi:hypothetical protein
MLVGITHYSRGGAPGIVNRLVRPSDKEVNSSPDPTWAAPQCEMRVGRGGYRCTADVGASGMVK